MWLINTMSASVSDRTPPLNIRIKADQRSLIEQAAQVSAKTVSDFVRDAALQEAQFALLDRTHLFFSEVEWDRFIEMLDKPPDKNARLQDLMNRKPVWEK